MSCVSTNGASETRVDLLLFNMVDFEIILDMDWLSSYYVILDYPIKTMTLPIQDYQG